MKLWIDDFRDAPDDSWVEARKVDQAIRLLAMYNAVEISLDHDIENRPDDETFKAVAYFIGEKHSQTRFYGHAVMAAAPPKVTIHSDNPAGAKEMQYILKSYGIDAPWVPFTSNEDFKKKYGLSD